MDFIFPFGADKRNGRRLEVLRELGKVRGGVGFFCRMLSYRRQGRRAYLHIMNQGLRTSCPRYLTFIWLLKSLNFSFCVGEPMMIENVLDGINIPGNLSLTHAMSRPGTFGGASSPRSFAYSSRKLKIHLSTHLEFKLSMIFLE